ncbi:glycosyltransferase family 1 protein [Herbaspirillum sp.]|uniref:glycosyltransferase n=1 Tax=Herbaspirillum sp. TaxID=1890675 RepID=UPI001B009AC2|nr:glycosyltransferase family 1 protein [Herbaspirillum sp.]MBO9536959.1 glycosyltransferase [Herbaspirillum sp.]
MSKSTLKVLHLPTTVGGNPQGLSKQLGKAGVFSKTWAFQGNYFNYDCDHVIWNQDDTFISREFKRLRAILNAAAHFDVIHFNFGQTLAQRSAKPNATSVLKKLKHTLSDCYLDILQIVELNLYKAYGRPLFVHYQGDDARQGDVSLKLFKYSAAQRVPEGHYSAETDALKRKMIQRLNKYCAQIYAVNPDLLHILPKRSRFIPYCHISLDEWQPFYTQRDNSRPLRIGHAPTNRAAKGTDLILAALDALAAEGYQYELVLVEGVSNAEARKKYESVDVLIDQLFYGWYGGLAVEAMALGKPVVVYIREEDLGFIPEQMKADLPFIQATPDTVKETLRHVLEMPREELYRLAQCSRAYVERWHDPVKIAKEIQADYEKALHHKGRF